MDKIELTEKEMEVVEELGHSLYTVDFLNQWLNRNDNVFVNAPSALQAMGTKGFYDAVKCMVKLKS